MAKAPEQLKLRGYRGYYYICGSNPRNHGETTRRQFDRDSFRGRSADTQISLTGSDRVISQSPQERTKGKRLDYCSRCYEGKHVVEHIIMIDATSIFIIEKHHTHAVCL